VAALLVRGPALVLELLRYDHELRKPAEFDLPAQGSKQMHIAPAELKMAERLVHEMEAPFKPGDFKDSYRDDLMALIRRKVKTGDTEASEGEEEEAPEPSNVVDIMALLQKSLGGKGASAAKKVKVKAKAAGAKRGAGKQVAQLKKPAGKPSAGKKATSAKKRPSAGKKSGLRKAG